MMRIVVKKLKTEDFEVVQSELLKFHRFKIDTLSNCGDYQNYCNDILVIDILQELFYLLRRKIESQKPSSNLILSPTQGVIFLYCHQWQIHQPSKQNDFVMQSISDTIHQNLINLI